MRDGTDCLPARSRVRGEGIGWFAVGFVVRPRDAKESNVGACVVCKARQITVWKPEKSKGAKP